MRKLLIAIICLAINVTISAQSVGIGTNTPSPSAQLEVSSTSKGMLIPRMSSAQRTTISNAETGLLVFDNTTGSFWFKGSSGWTELVDSVNNPWTKSNGNVYLPSGNAGIGSVTPVYNMYISKPSPSLAMYDAGKSAFSGLLQGDSTDLYVNAYRRSSFFTNQPGNLLLQVNGSGIPGSVAGNVGIGITNPDVKLHINGGTDVGGANGGFLQLGSSASTNIGFDNNEIQARNNGVVAKLSVQANGGDFQTGSGTGIYTFTAAGELNHNPVTGAANMIPICYGRVGSGGNILGGTGNFTVTKNNILNGLYSIAITGETTMSANPNNYIILVTPASILGEAAEQFVFAASEIQSSGNVFDVRTKNFVVDYTNKSVANSCNGFNCDPTQVSLLSNMPSPRYTDAAFCFVVYKL